MEGRLPAKRSDFTNEEVVGFKLPAESSVWDSPRRGKTKLVYSKQKVITCAMWILMMRWREKNKKVHGYKFKYKQYQYYDFITYFMSLLVIKVLNEEYEFNMPYRLGKLKMIKFRNTYIDEFGRIHLNLHSFRMKHYFLWSFGSIKSFKLIKLEKLKTIKISLLNKLRFNANCIDSFFYFVKSKKRHGAWVGAPDRDFDKLYKILEENYGKNIYRPNFTRLD